MPLALALQPPLPLSVTRSTPAVEWSLSARTWPRATSTALALAAREPQPIPTVSLPPNRPPHLSPPAATTPTTAPPWVPSTPPWQTTAPQLPSHTNRALSPGRPVFWPAVPPLARNQWWANSAPRCLPTPRRSTSARSATSGSRVHLRCRRICTATLVKSVSFLFLKANHSKFILTSFFSSIRVWCRRLRAALLRCLKPASTQEGPQGREGHRLWWWRRVIRETTFIRLHSSIRCGNPVECSLSCPFRAQSARPSTRRKLVLPMPWADPWTNCVGMFSTNGSRFLVSLYNSMDHLFITFFFSISTPDKHFLIGERDAYTYHTPSKTVCDLWV